MSELFAADADIAAMPLRGARRSAALPSGRNGRGECFCVAAAGGENRTDQDEPEKDSKAAQLRHSGANQDSL
jgi:hypothetical protein